MTLLHNRKSISFVSFCIFCLSVLVTAQVFGATSAGYSEYYIPGDEDSLNTVLEELGTGNQAGDMHVVISVTAWADDTIVYYDHWENGYDFDPDDPENTYDERDALARGGSRIYEESNVPLPRSGANLIKTAGPPVTYYYDGRDRIYVVGGAVTVTRASWTEATGTVLAVAWEVFPVRPQLTTYILPFGEDLVSLSGYQDFERVYALIQATGNNTLVTVDQDGDGVADQLDVDRDGIFDATSVTLQKGEVFLLDRVVLSGSSAVYAFDDFSSGDYAGGTGWETDWDEIGDNNDPTDGDSYISGGQLSFDDDDTNQNSIERSVNLTGAASAWLSFDYDTSGNLEGGDSIRLDVYDGTAWNFLQTFTDDVSGFYTADISSYISSDTRVRFSLSGGYDGNGEYFYVDDVLISGSLPINNTLDAGTKIQSSQTIQVQYIIGEEDSQYEIRGLSAFPRGFWDDEYYAPVDGHVASGDPTEIYLYNPHDNSIIVNYETRAGSGSFVIPAKSTLSYSDGSGGYVPVDSSVYLKGSDVFWGISTIDAEGLTHDWGYSLVPAFLLENEHFIGWAPGAYPSASGGDADDSGVYVAAAQDNVRLYVDYDNDGSVDDTYDLARLETQYIFDASDGNMSNANFYATGPYVLAYGQNPDTSATGSPAIDVGYTSIPGNDFISLVFTVDKSVSPQVLPTASGSTAEWTMEVNTYDFNIDGVEVIDTLPSGWQYVDDSTTITWPDNTTTSGNAADPGIDGSGLILTWPDTLLGDMDSNQSISVTFTAETNTAFASDDISRNEVEATGSRTVGGVTQDFSTTDFAFVAFSSATLEIEKTSDVDPVVFPGDTVLYTVAVTNSGAAALTNVSIYDPLPDGVSYVTGSAQVTLSSGATPLNDFLDFESGTQGFASSGTYGTTTWEHGVPQTHQGATCVTDCYGTGPAADHTNPGVNCWGTDLNDRYANNIPAPGNANAIYLYSPVYNFSGRTSVAISYWEWLEIECNNYDRAYFQYSVNGGAWTNAFTYGDTEPSRADNAWSQFTHDASVYADGQSSVQWRWSINSDGGWQWGGWYIDDVSVTASAGTLSADDPPNFVSASDNITIPSGETLTLIYNVTVNDPLGIGITEITNRAYVTTDELAIPLSDEETFSVNNPSSATGEVGDLVWLDTDGDGVKDIGEPGLSNVQVTLKDEFGTPLSVTNTDGSGRYRFTGITPGDDYYVEITGGLPSGLEQSAPSGHSDDRSDAFDLSAGGVYLDADLGYTNASGTGSIGDLVWSDADGNGTKASGEQGLSGMTVLLYLDVDNDGLFEPGTDDGAAIASVVTGADGSYLFSGVTATGSEDYFVFVDASQTALTGYSNTTPISTQVDNLADGDARLANDFGFRNLTSPTYTYKDRVWFDADEDQDDDDVTTTDNGETGISGVSVNLLDASRNVLATVTTDANGYFTFSGLSGGTFYYAQISDTSGKLTDYFGTTAEAVAGEIQISNLTADRDDTVEPTEPNFGYSLNGAIGDTVFNDVDGNGTQGTGELGISGVSVALYNDDGGGVPANAGNGVIDAGESLAATLLTDANGNYLFSGLADGDYIVSIGTPPSGFSFTGTDSDTSAVGDQLSASITSGNSDLTKDFGYQSADNRSVSGTLWDDSDNEGDFDETVYFENVTVELRDSTGTTLIGTTSTNSVGAYSFTGLPSAVYTVRVTDENGVLNGYSTTYEKTEGAKAGSYNGEESADLTSADVSDADFGYYKPPTVTRAVIGDFGAFNEGGKVVVRWQTVSEHGTVGFYLHRLNTNTGQYKSVNAKLLSGLLHSPAGGSYSYEDKKAKTNTYYTYRLEEVEAGGKRITYGPWQVYTGTLLSAEDAVIKLDAHSSITGYRKAEQPVSDKKIARLTEKMESRLSGYAKKLSRTGVRAKIYVEEDGLYFIDANDIAIALNITVKKATKQIKRNYVRLRSMGQNVAVWPAEDNSGLYFYGERKETQYSKENVYWLDFYKTLKMREVERSPKKPAEDLQYFYQWVWEEESNYPMTALFSDPSDDFWMWDYIFPGSVDQVVVSVSTPGLMDVDDATISVALQGATDIFSGNDHHALIRVNGVDVGEIQWDGFNSTIISVSVASAILNDGENIVEVVGINDPDVEFNYFYVNNLQIVYPRSYTSVDNQLTAENNGYLTMRLGGYADADIRVFDITNPRRPKVLAKTLVEASISGSGDFQVSFRSGNLLRRYLAITPDKIKSCTLIADQPSYLKKRFNLGDYIIITSTDMVAAAQNLADYRSAQGYVSQVVDIEDIYDEFSYGIADAEAIRSFLAYAYSKWKIPPKYVLLAGDGSFDYNDNKGFGDSVIPALLSSIPEDGMRVTDLPYSDVAGNDWVPEFALGRVPVISESELLDYINKVIGYESSDGEWTRQVVLAADVADAGGDFIISSEEVAGIFPGDFLLDKLYMDDVMSMSTARANFIADINEGRAFVNFIGHGTMFQIGNKKLFSTAELDDLNNSTKLPVFTAMTCVAGDFGYPGYDALNEGLVLKADGGAIAMWAPSGFTFNDQSVELCKGFYNAVFIGGETVLGDAIRRSQENFAGQGEKLYHLGLYNLIGDPALRLK